MARFVYKMGLCHHGVSVYTSCCIKLDGSLGDLLFAEDRCSLLSDKSEFHIPFGHPNIVKISRFLNIQGSSCLILILQRWFSVNRSGIHNGTIVVVLSVGISVRDHISQEGDLVYAGELGNSLQMKCLASTKLVHICLKYSKSVYYSQRY